MKKYSFNPKIFEFDFESDWLINDDSLKNERSIYGGSVGLQ